MLDNMTAIVTGGARGLGLGIAQSLAINGAKVAIWDYDEDALETAVAAVSIYGEVVQAARVDVTNSVDITHALSALIDVTGSVEILVNNAGINGDRSVRRMTEEFWDTVIATNLKSQFLCSKAVLEKMVPNNFGRIINVSSRAWLGSAGQASYAASKGGVVSFTRSLALEFAQKGITVNAIAPGIHETPMFNALSAELQDKLKASVPMGRIGQPGDIGNAVCFFADRRSSYVTGQTLYVCGGRSLASPSV